MGRRGICAGIRLLPVVLLLPAVPLGAEPAAVFSGEAAVVLSSLPEAALTVRRQVTVPFLRGNGPLTADNSIRASLGLELSPVSLYGLADLVWTPAAFFQLAAGTKLGSGWNTELFGSPVYGIGINRPRGASRRAEIDGDPFDGLHWDFRGGGVLQFDLAVLFPGDWHHVVFRSCHELHHRGYSRASAGDSWVFANDDGENRNGYTYYGNVFLGYRMPIFLNTAGLMAEMDKSLYAVPNEEDWGGDLVRWTFSGVLNVTLTERIGAALLVQCRTRRNYRDGDRKNEHRYFYQYRTLDRGNPLRLEFYRIAAAMTVSW
ncbi:MAG: hypothetical protein LBP23_00190 [Treponema sp.]|jgi:hypothetical protein|nr:hypothetical protein [Treponema sp.]